MTVEPLPNCAERIEAEAAEWLQRRHFWSWKDEDQERLDSWLNETPAHLVAYLRLEAALTRADRMAALRQPLSTRLAQLARRGWWPGVGRIAAGLILAGLIALGLTQYSGTPKDRAYATAVGERKIITLADGSRIELNTNTVVRLANNGDGRQAWLDKGEAYFQIHHDAAHPFSVVVGDHRVVDLGTRFLVRKEPSRIEVSLIEGSARVDTLSSWRPSQSALLTPGDVVIATADSMSLMKRPGTSIADELGWRRGLLVFRDTTLADAAAEFNRYSTHKIVVADPATAALIVGGTFPADDATMFVRAAKALFKLHVETKGNETVIRR